MQRLVRMLVLCLALAPLPVRGQNVAPIVPAGMRAIGNAKNWQLLEPLVYRVGTSRDSVVVPIGFVTDFASIPQELQSMISALGEHALPAVVHDYLYWEQVCSREQADRLFLKAMTEQQTPDDRRRAMFNAVRLFGQNAWDQNALERGADLPRVVPAGLRAPAALESWPAYRSFLKDNGVRPNARARISPAFCAQGNR